jgi:hypothetical protein
MDETKNVAAKSAVETTTQPSSPQGKVPETQVETTIKEQPIVEPDLPNEESEARRAFQQQRLENKQLKEELDRLKSEQDGRIRNESAFDSFRAPTQPGVKQVDINQFADPNTGEVNWNAYNAAQTANVQAVAAAQSAQTVKDQLDEYQARSKYPDVFSDKELEKEVAARYLFEKLNGNTNVTVESLAGQVAKRVNKALDKAAQQGAEQALTELSPKEQASLAVSGTTSAPSRQARSAEEQEALSLKTRRGGEEAIDAIAQRLAGRR